jgi:hypothetical protein
MPKAVPSQVVAAIDLTRQDYADLSFISDADVRHSIEQGGGATAFGWTRLGVVQIGVFSKEARAPATIPTLVAL